MEPIAEFWSGKAPKRLDAKPGVRMIHTDVCYWADYLADLSNVAFGPARILRVNRPAKSEPLPLMCHLVELAAPWADGSAGPPV